MKIESINIGLPTGVSLDGKMVTTGIYKQPVAEAIRVGVNGLEGDGVGDLKHHGGRDKAVCVYSADYYSYWEEVLSVKLPVAAFGENFTLSDMKESEVCIGDVFEVSGVLLQVSQPRQPCRTLAARHNRNDLVKLVVDSGYTGFYFRVLKEGVVKTGDVLILKERPHAEISVAFANHTFHHDKHNRQAVEKVLSAKELSLSWQESFSKLLEK
ncbi:MAG: MOSC domain-containing protein [Candidatus Magnetoovum sp. WYHC-5]|nr:MOSC domain-containing protein [Candidatus Magnetoovum sp. WYHC-5]